MKVAHLAVITPNRCGLYETTRELVAGLRGLGVDSRLVDPSPRDDVEKPADEDRGAPYASMGWAVDADLLINHSGYDNTPLEKAKIPVIHICHGRPRSSFLSELAGKTPIFSYHYQKNKDPRIKAVVTFWPEHVEYHKVMFPDKPVYYVQAPADMAEWSYEGPKGYKFHGKKGRVNVVLTDPFRDDVDAFVPLHAACLLAREVEQTKIHIYGCRYDKKKGFSAILRRLQDDGCLGEVNGWVGGLANVYRAATFMLTANEIDTRSAREAELCGCPVVRVPRLDDQFRVRMRKAMMANEPDRKLLAMQAKAKFNPQVTAKQFKDVIETCAG
jgi:hypothetical protein